MAPVFVPVCLVPANAFAAAGSPIAGVWFLPLQVARLPASGHQLYHPLLDIISFKTDFPLSF